MDGLTMGNYEPEKLNSEQRAALNRTRDQFALVEELADLLVLEAGKLSHMRTSAARLINYSYPSVMVSGLADGSDDLASALGAMQAGSAAVQRCHAKDIALLESAGIKAGRPRTRRLREFAEHMLDRIEGMVKFGR